MAHILRPAAEADAADLPSRGYRWSLEISRGNGSPLAEVPFVPDWEPAREWLTLLALNGGGAVGSAGTEARVADDLARLVPLWHERLGAPRVRGFRASSGGVSHDFPLTYFGEAAYEAARRLIDEGRLADGERFEYLAVAHATTIGVSRAADRERFSVEVLPVAPRLLPGRLDDVLAGAEGRDAPERAAFPVLVPRRVLDDAARLARSVGDVEAGGILLGHPRRDSTTGSVFVELTALIDAPCTRPSSDRITFTPDTWNAVRRITTLRARDEQRVGWFHSHPAHAWCRSCSPEARRRCRLGHAFLSADDRVLHRAVFPAAWSVALLVTVVGYGPEEPALFGWNEGTIERRGYHVIPDREDGAAAGKDTIHA